MTLLQNRCVLSADASMHDARARALCFGFSASLAGRASMHYSAECATGLLAAWHHLQFGSYARRLVSGDLIVDLER